MLNIVNMDCPDNINLTTIIDTFVSLNTLKGLEIIPSIDTKIIIADVKHKKDLYNSCIFPYNNKEYPGDHSFRSWCDITSDTIYIFVDDIETTSSIIWLIIHELIHRSVLTNRMMYLYMNTLRLEYVTNTLKSENIQEYYTDVYSSTVDSIHDNDPEERMANDIATTLTGYMYDSQWWRLRHKEYNQVK